MENCFWNIASHWYDGTMKNRSDSEAHQNGIDIVVELLGQMLCKLYIFSCLSCTESYPPSSKL